MENNDINIIKENVNLTPNDDRSCELLSTIERISQMTIKKERKYIPPRRTESKKLNTYKELNANNKSFERSRYKNDFYTKNIKSIYNRGTLKYRSEYESFINY